jgi:hypothetical protein
VINHLETFIISVYEYSSQMLPEFCRDMVQFIDKA